MIAVVIPYPGWGQLLALYKFARCLKDEGYRVMIATTAEYQQSVQANGFEGLVYSSYSQASQAQQPERKERKLSRFYRQMKERDQYVDNMVDVIVKRIRPDIVFIDSGLNRIVFPFMSRRVRIVTFSTSLAGDESPDNPPYCSSIIPRYTFFHRMYIALYWQAWYLRKWWFYFRSEILSLGYFDHSLARICRAYGFSGRILNRRRVWHVGFKNIPELLFYPEEFEFAKNINKNKHYIGPMMDLSRDESAFSSLFSWDAVKIHGPVVCCSLGTNAWTFDQDIDVFYRKIIDVFHRLPQHTLIIAVGRQSKIDRGHLPDNIYVYDTIPQIEVLRRADLMINHAGIGSVKECVLMGIPMLCFPLDARIDQRGTAARVEFFGLGLRGDHKRETVTGLLRKIDFVLSCSSIKDNVSRWRDIFGGSDRHTSISSIIYGEDISNGGSGVHWN